MLRPRTKYAMMYVIAITAGEGGNAVSQGRYMPSANKGTPGMATVYFVLAVCLGAYMGASQDHTFLSVHAHLNLLGWVSLAIIGCIYLLKPKLATTRLAQLHFWLHNIGAPVLLVAVAFIHSGSVEIAGPIAGISSIVTVIGIMCFAVNLWRGIDRA